MSLSTIGDFKREIDLFGVGNYTLVEQWGFGVHILIIDLKWWQFSRKKRIRSMIDIVMQKRCLPVGVILITNINYK